MTFNDVRFNYGFEVQFVPVLRSFLQHCIQVRLIGDDLACSFGSFPKMPASMMTGSPVT
jgi:hypothetical protein